MLSIPGLAAVAAALRLLRLLPLLLLLVQTCTTASIDLDSTPWEFEADPMGVGAQERWFDPRAKPRLARTITTPGAWEAQGVGNATALMPHQLLGVGWYRKTVPLQPPGAAGASTWLWIGGAPGGVMRSARVWANGVFIGRHLGYLEPLEMDLRLGAPAGAASLVLAVAVDSRWNHTEDPLFGSGSFWNYGGVGTGGGGGDGYSFGGYGGIVGHAKLLVRQRAWVEDSVHTRCQPAGAGADADAVGTGTGTGADWTCRVTFGLAGQVGANDTVALSVCPWNGGAAARCVRATGPAPAGGRATLDVTIPEARLWIPGTREPRANLYIANLTLVQEAGRRRVLDTRLTRFGVRTMSTDGPRIMFNGEAVFLRGYGDDGQYGSTAAPPMEKGFYLTQLTAMKALGFNFVRFHTHSMPTEFFDAADELGFLCDPEFAMNYAYVWRTPPPLHTLPKCGVRFISACSPCRTRIAARENDLAAHNKFIISRSTL